MTTTLVGQPTSSHQFCPGLFYPLSSSEHILPLFLSIPSFYICNQFPGPIDFYFEISMESTMQMSNFTSITVISKTNINSQITAMNSRKKQSRPRHTAHLWKTQALSQIQDASHYSTAYILTPQTMHGNGLAPLKHQPQFNVKTHYESSKFLTKERHSPHSHKLLLNHQPVACVIYLANQYQALQTCGWLLSTDFVMISLQHFFKLFQKELQNPSQHNTTDGHG